MSFNPADELNRLSGVSSSNRELHIVADSVGCTINGVTDSSWIPSADAAAGVAYLYLKTFETDIFVVNSDASNTYDLHLMLPPAAECGGTVFTVTLISNADTANFNCILDDNDKSADWGGDYTLDAALDMISIKSNGYAWVIQENRIS